MLHWWCFVYPCCLFYVELVLFFLSRLSFLCCTGFVLSIQVVLLCCTGAVLSIQVIFLCCTGVVFPIRIVLFYAPLVLFCLSRLSFSCFTDVVFPLRIVILRFAGVVGLSGLLFYFFNAVGFSSPECYFVSMVLFFHSRL